MDFTLQFSKVADDRDLKKYNYLCGSKTKLPPNKMYIMPYSRLLDPLSRDVVYIDTRAIYNALKKRNMDYVILTQGYEIDPSVVLCNDVATNQYIDIENRNADDMLSELRNFYVEVNGFELLMVLIPDAVTNHPVF